MTAAEPGRWRRGLLGSRVPLVDAVLRPQRGGSSIEPPPDREATRPPTPALPGPTAADAQRRKALRAGFAGLARPPAGGPIFLGHGRSPVWRELKDFLADRLGLPWEEFSRVPVAGVATVDRLGQMLESSAFAFLVLTAEDESDGTMIARQNVVHEVGLFQGRLGFGRAVVLLEEGCEEFSNIHGLGQIRFPRGRIGATFEEVRLVLEREGIVRA